jgi:uncharacterized protein YndB with AHSA1/START domain
MSLTLSYFAISRHVRAPRERLFRAWTDPLEVCRWYGSAPFSYRDVDAPGRLVFTTGDPEDPDAPLAIVTLSRANDHTVMTFEAAAPVAEADAVERGWNGLLDRLVDQVSQPGGNAGGILPG